MRVAVPPSHQLAVCSLQMQRRTQPARNRMQRCTGLSIASR